MRLQLLVIAVLGTVAASETRVWELEQTPQMRAMIGATSL